MNLSENGASEVQSYLFRYSHFHHIYLSFHNLDSEQGVFIGRFGIFWTLGL